MLLINCELYKETMNCCFYQYLIVKRCSCQYQILMSGVIYVSDFQNFCICIVTYTSFLLLAVIFPNERPEQNKNKSVWFKISTNWKKSKLVVYVDAAFDNLHDGGNQSAYLIFFVNPNEKFNLISWQSKRIKRMVCSSLAAEALAMLDGIDSALYIVALLNELIYDKSEQQIPMHCVADNKSLWDALASTKYITEKRSQIDIGALKEAIKNNNIEHISWVKTNEQLADSLTKYEASSVPLVNTCYMKENLVLLLQHIFSIFQRA